MKWYQFTTANFHKYIFAVDTTNKGVKVQLYHSLHEMPENVKRAYITDSLLNLENPLSIEEIAALRNNMQNIIANRLQQVAH